MPPRTHKMQTMKQHCGTHFS